MDGGTATRVLVVDDSFDARRLARRALELEGFSVEEAGDGNGALAALAGYAPDLVVLDVAMPGTSGLEVLTHIRRTGGLPVIVVSGRAEEADRVLAFELGADDYVVKPFLVRELPARIRTILRRTSRPPARGQLDFGRLVVRPREREALLDGRRVGLTVREFDLLTCLAAAPRKVFSRGELLAAAWGPTSDELGPATVTEHVRRLRRKIEDDPDDPRWLVTVWGIGYRFDPT